MKRILSLTLCLGLLTPPPAVASEAAGFFRSYFSRDIKNLAIPSKLGEITFKATTALDAKQDAPLVVLVQDLHANIGVQKNIAGIVQHLSNQYDLNMVMSEAAFGKCEPAALRMLQSRSAKRKLSEKLLSKALLSGTELASVMMGREILSPIQVWGVDDPNLYLENIQAFNDLAKVGIEAAQTWKSLRSMVEVGSGPELRAHFALVEKLMGLRLTPEDWQAYKKHKEWTPLRQPARGTVVGRAINAAERFYENAEARNQAMAANLLAALGYNSMDETPANRSEDRKTEIKKNYPPIFPSAHQSPVVALVTGGFHTDAIGKILEANHVRYVVVTPHVPDLNPKYEELYKQSLTEPPHETVLALLSTSKSFGAVRSFAAQTNEKLWTARWFRNRHLAPIVAAQEMGAPQTFQPALWQRVVDGLQASSFRLKQIAYAAVGVGGFAMLATIPAMAGTGTRLALSHGTSGLILTSGLFGVSLLAMIGMAWNAGRAPLSGNSERKQLPVWAARAERAVLVLGLVIPAFTAIGSYLHSGVPYMLGLDGLIQTHTEIVSHLPFLGVLPHGSGAVVGILAITIVFELGLLLVREIVVRPIASRMGYQLSGIGVFSNRAGLIEELKEEYQLSDAQVQALVAMNPTRTQLLEIANELSSQYSEQVQEEAFRTSQQKHQDSKKSLDAILNQHNVGGVIKLANGLMYWMKGKAKELLQTLHAFFGQFYVWRFMQRTLGLRKIAPANWAPTAEKIVAWKIQQFENPETVALPQQKPQQHLAGWAGTAYQSARAFFGKTTFFSGTAELFKKRLWMMLISSGGMGVLYGLVGDHGVLVNHGWVSSDFLGHSALPFVFALVVLSASFKLYDHYKNHKQAVASGRAPPHWIYAVLPIVYVVIIGAVYFADPSLAHFTKYGISLNLTYVAVISPFLTSLGLSAGRLVREEYQRKRSEIFLLKLSAEVPNFNEEMKQYELYHHSALNFRVISAVVHDLGNMSVEIRNKIASIIAEYLVNNEIVQESSLRPISEFARYELFESLKPYLPADQQNYIQPTRIQRFGWHLIAAKSTLFSRKSWMQLMHSWWNMWLVNPEIQAFVGVAGAIDNGISHALSGSWSTQDAQLLQGAQNAMATHPELSPKNAALTRYLETKDAAAVGHYQAEQMIHAVQQLPNDATADQVASTIHRAGSEFSAMADTINLVESNQQGVMGIGELFGKWFGDAFGFNLTDKLASLISRTPTGLYADATHVTYVQKLSAKFKEAYTKWGKPVEQPSPAATAPSSVAQTATPTPTPVTSPELLAQQEKERQFILRAAQERVQQAQGGAGKNLGAAKARVATTDNAIKQAEAVAAKNEERLAKKEQALIDARGQLDPDNTIAAKRPLEPLKQAYEKVKDLSGAKLAEKFKSLKARVQKALGQEDKEVLASVTAYEKVAEDLTLHEAELEAALNKGDSLSAQEAKALIQKIQAIRSDAAQLKALPKPLADLLKVMADLPEMGLTPAEVESLSEASNEKIPDALEALGKLLNAWTNWENFVAQQQALQADVVSKTKELEGAQAAKIAEFTGLRRLLAQHLERSLSKDRSLADWKEDVSLRLQALRTPQSEMGDVLRSLASAMDALNQAQTVLISEKDPDAIKAALTEASKALVDIQNARLFWATLQNATPEAQEKMLEALPIDPALLDQVKTKDGASARQNFEAFKAASKGLQLTDKQWMAKWYAQTLRDLLDRFDLDRAKRFMGSALRLLRKPSAQDGHAPVAAAEESAELAGLDAQLKQLAKAEQALEQLEQKIRTQAAALKDDVKSVSVETQPLKEEDLKHLVGALESYEKVKPEFNAKSQSARALESRISETISLLKAVQGQKELSLEQSDQLFDAMKGLLSVESLQVLMTPKESFTNLKPEQIKAMDALMYQTAMFGLRHFGGVAEERIKQGASGEQTEEDMAIALAQELARTTSQSVEAQKYINRVKREGKIFGFNLVWEAFEVMNLVYGIKNFQTNIRTMNHDLSKARPFIEQRIVEDKNPVVVGNNDTPPGPPVTSSTKIKDFIYVPPTAPFAIALGMANGAVNSLGVVNQAKILISGENPLQQTALYAYHLDSGVFKENMVWETFQMKDRLAPEEGYFYFFAPGGKAMKTKATQNASQIKASKSWARVSDNETLPGFFYTIVDGQRYVWVARDKQSFVQKLNTVRNLGTSALQAAQIWKGIFSKDAFQNHYAEIKNDWIARYLAAANLVGTIQSGLKVWDKVSFYRARLAKEGGWTNAPKLQVAAHFKEVVNGREVESIMTRSGEILYVRQNEKGDKRYDNTSGTVVAKESAAWRGVFNAFAYFRFSKGVDFWQDSKRAAQKAEKLLTDPHGQFSERRKESAPLVYDSATGLIRSFVGPKETTYKLENDRVYEVTLDGNKSRVKPFFDEKGNLVGVIQVDANDQPILNPKVRQAGTILTSAIYHYLYSNPEKASGFLAKLIEGSWLELGEIQSQISLKTIPGDSSNEGRWYYDATSEVEHFVPNGSDTPTISRWSDGANTYLFDERKPAEAQLYRLTKTADGQMRVLLKMASLRDLAKAKAALDRSYTWTKEDTNVQKPDAFSTPALPIQGVSPQDATAWIDRNGNTHIAVNKPIQIGASRLDVGTHQFQIGGKEIDRSQDQRANSPFILRSLFPFVPNFDALKSQGQVVSETRQGANGTETWHYVRLPRSDALSKEVSGVFVQYTENGEQRTDWVELSPRGLTYEKNKSRSDNFAWETRLIPSANVTRAAPAEWVSGSLPAEIKNHLGAAAATAQASYIQDSSTGEFFLRVQSVGEPTIYFAMKATAKGQSTIAAAQVNDAETNTLIQLPSSLPQTLLQKVSAKTNSPIIQKNGKWYLTETTRAGQEAYRMHLMYGQSLITSRSIQELQQEALASGLKMEPASQIPSRGTFYGGVRFRPYSNPYDPTAKEGAPIYSVLEALEDGQFVDPKDPAGKIQSIRKGQVLILGMGKADLELKEKHLAGALPYIEQSLLTPEMLFEKRAGEFRAGKNERARLPSFIGEGADQIPGRWYQEKNKTTGEWEYSYFQVGGSPNQTFEFKDAATGRIVKLPGGSLWHVNASRGSAERFVAFHEAGKNAWSLVMADHETLVSEYEAKALAEGLKAPSGKKVTLVPTVRNAQLLNSNVRGVVFASNANDPTAPKFFQVTQAGTYQDPLLGTITLKVGDELVYQWSHAYVKKAADETRGAAVVFQELGEEGAIIGLKTASFNIPELSDIRLSRDGRMVKRDRNGKDVMVDLKSPALIWQKNYQAGWGYIQINGGVHTVSVNGKNVSLAGWVGISKDKPNAGEVSFAWVKDHLVPKNGKNGDQGWLIKVNGKVIGEVQFGVKAAQYAIDHPEVGVDPNLLKEGIRAAVYYLEKEDGKTKSAYITNEDFKAISNRIINVVETSHGQWEAAVYWNPNPQNPNDGKWYPVEYVSEKNNWRIGQKPFVNQTVIGNRSAFGLVQPQFDGKIKVIGIVEFPPTKEKNKKIQKGIQLPDSARIAQMASATNQDPQAFQKQKLVEFSWNYIQLPHPEELRIVKLDDRGQPEINIDFNRGGTEISYVNLVNQKKSVDVLRGDRLVSRRMYADFEGKDLQVTIHYGPDGETQPQFRTIRDQQNREWVDEVYTDEGDPAFSQIKRIKTIRLLRHKLIPFNNDSSQNENDYVELQEKAKQAVAQRGAFYLTEDYSPQADSTVRKDNIQFRGANTEWKTGFVYDKNNRLIETRTNVYLENTSSPVGWMHSKVLEAKRAQDIPELRQLLESNDSKTQEGRASIGLTPETWIYISEVRTSWASNGYEDPNPTYREFRPVGDPRHVLFEQGTDRRFNVAFQGDNPTKTYMLNASGEVTGTSFYEKDALAKEVFTPAMIARIVAAEKDKGNLSLTADTFWEKMKSLGVTPETLIPQIKVDHRGMEGATTNTQSNYRGFWKGLYYQFFKEDPTKPSEKTLSYQENLTSEYLYLLPIDPPRGRVLAKVGVNGDFVLNKWWEEVEQVHLGKTQSFGRVPSTLTLLKKMPYWFWNFTSKPRAYREATYQATYVVPSLKNLTDLDGKPLPSWFQELEGQRLYQYQVSSPIGKDLQRSVLFSADGRLVAEVYEHEVFSPIKSAFGGKPLTSKQEMLFYDFRESYRAPAFSIGLDQNASGDTFFTQVLRQVDDIEFDVDGKQQVVYVYQREREGMDANVIHLQMLDFVDGESNSKARPDLIVSLFSAPLVGGVGVVVAYIGSLRLVIAIARWWGRYKRSKKQSLNVSTVSQTASVDSSETKNELTLKGIKSQISSIQTKYQEESVSADFKFVDTFRVAGDTLEKLLESHIEQGGTLESFFKTYFEPYQHWSEDVLKQSAAAWIGNPMSKAKKTASEDQLENLYLQFVIYTFMGNFRNPTPDFLNYVFNSAVKIKNENKTVERKQRLTLLVYERATWNHVLASGATNVEFASGLPEKLIQDARMLYSDMNAYFRSPRFIQAYQHFTEYLMKPASQSPKRLKGKHKDTDIILEAIPYLQDVERHHLSRVSQGNSSHSKTENRRQTTEAIPFFLTNEEQERVDAIVEKIQYKKDADENERAKARNNLRKNETLKIRYEQSMEKKNALKINREGSTRGSAFWGYLRALKTFYWLVSLMLVSFLPFLALGFDLPFHLLDGLSVVLGVGVWATIGRGGIKPIGSWEQKKLTSLLRFGALMLPGMVSMLTFILFGGAAHFSAITIVGTVLMSTLALGKWALEKQFAPSGFISDYVSPRPIESVVTNKTAQQERRKTLVKGYMFWIPVLAEKFLWNYFVFKWLQTPTLSLLHASGDEYVKIGLLLLMWTGFFLFYLLDTFSFFYLKQAYHGAALAGKEGVSQLKSWDDLSRSWEDAQKNYASKMIPTEVSAAWGAKRDVYQQVAWAREWNRILYYLLEEDRVSLDEWNALRYPLEDEESESTYPLHPDKAIARFYQTHTDRTPHFLDVKILGKPDLAKGVQNETTRTYLVQYVNSLLMDLPNMPLLKNTSTQTTVLPNYEEDPIYTYDLITKIDRYRFPEGKIGNDTENWEEVWLGKAIRDHSQDFRNLITRLQNTQENGKTLLDQYPQDFEKLEKILNDPLSALHLEIDSETIRMELRLFVSYRFQPGIRTIRGIEYRRSALQLQAQIEFAAEWAKKSKSIADQQKEALQNANSKFQHLWGTQVYSEKWRGKAIEKDIDYIRSKFPDIELVYQDQKDGEFASVWEGSRTNEKKEYPTRRVPIPSGILKDQGKPENQNHTLTFATGEVINTMDINMDMSFSNNRFYSHAMQTFKQDPSVAIIGFPERIMSQDFSPIGLRAGFADGTFGGFTQHQLADLGGRLHYGHPDFHRASSVRTQGGLSSPDQVNEDIFAGYNIFPKGYRAVFLPYLYAEKAREVGILAAFGFYQKLGAGSGQQTLSFGLENFLQKVSLPVAFTLIFGGVGYFVRKKLVKWAGLIYQVSVMLIGVSGFVSFPSEIFFGILGMWLSQAIGMPGLSLLMVQKPTFRAIWKYIWMLPLMVLFFQANILTLAGGFSFAMISLAAYVATGRGPQLGHYSFEQNYQKFKSSHFTYSWFTLVINAIGIFIWQSPALMWSAPFILQSLSGLLSIFLLNKGGTPVDVGIARWKALMKEDWASWWELTPIRYSYGRYRKQKELQKKRNEVLESNQLSSEEKTKALEEIKKEYPTNIFSVNPNVFAARDIVERRNHPNWWTRVRGKFNAMYHHFFVGPVGLTILIFASVIGFALAPVSVRNWEKERWQGLGLGMIGNFLLFLPVGFVLISSSTFGAFQFAIGLTLLSIIAQVIYNWKKPPVTLQLEKPQGPTNQGPEKIENYRQHVWQILKTLPSKTKQWFGSREDGPKNPPQLQLSLVSVLWVMSPALGLIGLGVMSIVWLFRKWGSLQHLNVIKSYASAV